MADFILSRGSSGRPKRMILLERSNECKGRIEIVGLVWDTLAESEIWETLSAARASKMKQRRKFAKPYQGQSKTCRLHQMEGVSRREDVEFYITLATLTKKKTPGKTAKEVVLVRIHLIVSYVWYSAWSTMSKAQKHSEAVVNSSWPNYSDVSYCWFLCGRIYIMHH